MKISLGIPEKSQLCPEHKALDLNIRHQEYSADCSLHIYILLP
jgi:hypothetical protein